MPKSRSRQKRGTSSRLKNVDLEERTPAEQLEHVIADLEVQIPRKIDAFVKEFEREAMKMVKMLPDKSIIPPEIYNMPYSEFILRGGTFATVIDSLREDKLREEKEKAFKDSEQPAVAITKAVAEPKENLNPFVTPFVGTRSQGMTSATTARRLPKPLEEVMVSTVSKETGSPVNEVAAFKAHEDTIRMKVQSEVMDAMSAMPKKWRSMLEKKFTEMSTREIDFMETEEPLTLVTPAITSRTRKAHQSPPTCKKTRGATRKH